LKQTPDEWPCKIVRVFENDKWPQQRCLQLTVKRKNYDATASSLTFLTGDVFWSYSYSWPEMVCQLNF